MEEKVEIEKPKKETQTEASVFASLVFFLLLVVCSDRHDFAFHSRRGACVYS